MTIAHYVTWWQQTGPQKLVLWKLITYGADLALDGSEWVVKPLISRFSAPMRYTSLTSGRRPKINASCNSNENSRVTFCWLSIYEKSRTTFPQPPKLRKFLRNFFPRKSRQRVLSLEEKFSEKFRQPYFRRRNFPKNLGDLTSEQIFYRNHSLGATDVFSMLAG